MKRFKILILSIISLAMLSFVTGEKESEEGQKKVSIPFSDYKNTYPFVSDNIPQSGPELEHWYFSQWNYPHGAVLDPDFLNKTWAQIKTVPSEEELERSITNAWRMIGPYGSNHTTSGAKYSGRILDIEVGNSTNPIMASASGGLWTYIGFLPFSISDDVTSLACGSFTTNPSDVNIILLGTGEPGQRSGTGLWRSTNSGTSWTKIDLTPQPTGFYKIRHQAFFSSIVHAATSSGYFRSTDSGLSWLKTFTGNVTDIAINPVNPNIIYAGKRGDGIYKSTNNGLNFSKVTTPGIPTVDVGRISLAIGTSNSNKVYASVVRESNSQMLGVYLSANEGATWSNVSPPENIFRSQGWYNNIIGICPTNSNIVLVGGVTLWRSVNSGAAWTEIDEDVHADQHAMEWTSDGNSVYVGNDGGLIVSTDQGATFSTSINYLPITQYVNFDVGVSNRGVIYGGSQDNGFTGTTNGGSSWLFTKGGDGGGIAIDPISALYIYGTAGVYTGAHTFRRYKSTDKGLTWDTTNIGVEPSTQWYTKMRSDRVGSIKLYTNSGPYVYVSANEGDTWSKLNATPFPSTISNLNVTKYSAPSAVIYASLNSTTAGQRLRVYDGGNFFERSSGLPSGLFVRGVATHITNTNTAYALMNGFSDGEKVYKTTNKGINWQNISGNLPDVPLADLVPHPSNNNNLYLGTQMGCYRTTNAGVSWHRWNNGMPGSNIITELKWIDSTIENGKFYIVASSYGRSLWVRDISGDDPANILSLTLFVQGFYNQGTNTMIRDTVRVYLRSDESPYSVVDSAKTFIFSGGTASLTFPLAFNDEYYYIQLKHRNSIETWSSTAENFEDHSMTYNFSSNINNAFGNNLIMVDASPVRYAIYSGDVSQDGTVDIKDLSLIDNDAFNFASGYIRTDITGDNITDLSDYALADNNAANFVSVVRP